MTSIPTVAPIGYAANLALPPTWNAVPQITHISKKDKIISMTVRRQGLWAQIALFDKRVFLAHGNH